MQEQLAVVAWFDTLAVTSSVIIRNALITVTVCRIFYIFIFILLIIWPPTSSKLSAMIGCFRTCVRKQPIIALYFENVLKFYNPEAWSMTFTNNSGSSIGGSHQSGSACWANHDLPKPLAPLIFGTFAVIQILVWWFARATSSLGHALLSGNRTRSMGLIQTFHTYVSITFGLKHEMAHFIYTIKLCLSIHYT